MKNVLWQCSEKKLRKSNLFKFENFIKKKYGINTRQDYNLLWQWSVKNSAEFWKSIWEFSNIKGKLGNKLVRSSKIFYKNVFLPDSKLNFSENLLSKKDNSIALTFISENGYKENKTWNELNKDFFKVSNFLKSIGIKKNGIIKYRTLIKEKLQKLKLSLVYSDPRVMPKSI